MKTFFGISVALHLLLFLCLFWADDISFFLNKLLRLEQSELERPGVIQVDLTYKPTYTSMKKGSEKKDLPPPKVPKAKPKDDRPVLVKKKSKKTKAPPKPDLSKIIGAMRKEAVNEKRPMPREDNFPVTEDGMENARGTGGRSTKQMSPAEQALSAAMRRYFEFPGAEAMRKKYPDVHGFLQLKLVGVGNQFEIVSLRTAQSSGFTILDKSCELAIRRAIAKESFAKDIIKELSAKETLVTCQP